MSTIPDPKYFECHVTIEPVFDVRLELLRSTAAVFRFRVAELLMKKHRQATAIRSDWDAFTTARGDDFWELRDRMNRFAEALRELGFQVWRTKIEAILFDERHKPPE